MPRRAQGVRVEIRCNMKARKLEFCLEGFGMETEGVFAEQVQVTQPTNQPTAVAALSLLLMMLAADAFRLPCADAFPLLSFDLLVWSRDAAQASFPVGGSSCRRTEYGHARTYTLQRTL